MVSAQKLSAILIISLFVVPLAFAADMLLDGEELQPTVIIKYQGSRAITDALSAKSSGEKSAVLTTATKDALKDVRYPYTVADSELTILKSKCGDFYNDGNQICGYWIACTRDGKEVYTDSPILISPLPYEVLVSSIYDSKTNIQTDTYREDPKSAIEEELKKHCDRQPLGKAVSYER